MTPKEIFEILKKEFGLLPNEEEDAQKWFKEVYNKANIEVKKALLELLSYDVIRPSNNDEKIMWIFRAVFHGKLKNKKLLRQLYYEGHGNENLRAEIVDYIKSDAEKEDLESIIFMGHIHTAGFGVEKNDNLAHYWYHKAAEKGDAGAQLAVGDYHFHKEEYEDAHNWYHKAAKQNKKTAYIRLSRMYQIGLGVEQSKEKSLYYKNKLIKSKNSDLKISSNKVKIKNKVRAYRPKFKKHEKK